MGSGISILQKSSFQVPLLIETATALKKKDRYKVYSFSPESEILGGYLGVNHDRLLKKFRGKSMPDSLPAC